MTPEIETEIPSLKLRLLKEEDAEELSLRVDQNTEHLRRWLPWLDGAKDTADQLKRLAGPARFDLDRDEAMTAASICAGSID